MSDETEATWQPAEPGLTEQLREMWQRLDPVPADLVERTCFALELEALTAADLQLELMRLSETQVPLSAGARGGDDVRSVTFASESLTVMLAIGEAEGDHGHRVDGWIAPGGRRRIEVRTATGTAYQHSDDNGRFVLTGVPSGHLQLVLSVDDDSQPGRTVITPALTL